jgi:dihydrofolate reductase
MKLNIVASIDQNGVLGGRGDTPWFTIPADQERLTALSDGGIVIMDLETYNLTLTGKPLAGCVNVVVSNGHTTSRESGARHESDVSIPGCFVASSLLEVPVLPLGAWAERPIFVIGGEALFAVALKIAEPGSRLYLSRVNLEQGKGPRFPKFELGEWKLTFPAVRRYGADTNNVRVCFETYELTAG